MTLFDDKTLNSQKHSARNIGSGSAATPTPGKLHFVPIETVGKWEKNPRKYFDDEALEELASNIKIHGILQPIVVCDNSDDPEKFGDRPTRFTVIMGERRRRAAVLAGLETVPIIVRRVADEGEMLLLAMSENSARKDTNPIEDGQAYASLIHEFRYTQAQIGAQAGHSQAMISKLIGLLRLPHDVQLLILQGKLKTAHGVAILRFDGFFAIMSEMARWAAERQTPSKQLEQGIPFANDLLQLKLIQAIPSYAPPFDIKICEACPFNAYRKAKSPGGSDYHYCLKPDHYAQLETDQKKRAIESAKKQAELDQQKAISELARAKEFAAQAATAKDRQAAERSIQSAEKVIEAGKKGMPKLSSLDYRKYEQIYGDPPAGCTASCPCRMKALGHNDREVDVCMDPGRLSGLKSALTRNAQKGRKVLFDGLRQRIRAEGPAIPLERQATLLAWEYLSGSFSGKTEVLRDVAADLPPGPAKAFLGRIAGSINHSLAASYWDDMAALGVEALLRLVGEIRCRQELAYAYSIQSSSHERTQWWLGEAPPPDRVYVRVFVDGEQQVKTGVRIKQSGGQAHVLIDGKTSSRWVFSDTVASVPMDSSQSVAIDSSQSVVIDSANAREKVVPAAALVGILDDDTTLTPTIMTQSETGDDPEACSCIRCDAVISGELSRELDNALDASLLTNPALTNPAPKNPKIQTPHGILLTPRGAIYCAECAPGVEICRVCGCTDEEGCIGGCYWAEKELCSRCIGDSQSEEPVRRDVTKTGEEDTHA